MGVTIAKKLEGGCKIEFSAANYITGSDTQELVDVFNNSDGNKLTGSYVDKDGHTWEVTVNVTFTLAIAEDVEIVTIASVEQKAENLINNDYLYEANGGKSEHRKYLWFRVNPGR